MAIDTAEKRRNVASIGVIPILPEVTPNATQDQEWRQQAGWGYGGILAGTGPTVTPDATSRVPWWKMIAIRR